MEISKEIRSIVIDQLPPGLGVTAEIISDMILEILPPDLDVGWLEENARMRIAIEKIIVPHVVATWLRKNLDYAGQQVFLGKRAQFADINRKFWKLKRAMWDDESLGFEQPVEIMSDMIGHLLMAIYMEMKAKGEISDG